MKRLRKRTAGVMLALGLVSIVNPISAHAEWKQSANGWMYAENGTNKTGWLQDGGKWYYLSTKGVMLNGWIIDKGTWYYLLQDGSLDSSKTTTTMPSDIKATYDIVKYFSGSFNIKYAGKGFVKNKDGFNNYGIENKYVLIFSAQDEYGNNPDYYFVYDPYACKVYKLNDNLTIEYLGQGKQTNSITQDQAKQIVQNYLKENQINIPNLTFNIYDEKNNSYFILCQEINVDHVNTVESYYVDKTTGLVLSKNYI